MQNLRQLLCLIKGMSDLRKKRRFPPRRRIYIRREEGNGGRKRPLNQRNPSDFYLKLSHLWFLLYLRWFLGIFRSFSVFPNVTAPFLYNENPIMVVGSYEGYADEKECGRNRTK